MKVLILRSLVAVVSLCYGLTTHTSDKPGKKIDKTTWLQVKIRSVSAGAEDEEDYDHWHISHGQKMPWSLEIRKTDANFKKHPNSQDCIINMALYALQLGLADDEESLEQRTLECLASLKAIQNLCAKGIEGIEQLQRQTESASTSALPKSPKPRKPQRLRALSESGLSDSFFPAVSYSPLSDDSLPDRTASAPLLPKIPEAAEDTVSEQESEPASATDDSLAMSTQSSPALAPVESPAAAVLTSLLE